MYNFVYSEVNIVHRTRVHRRGLHLMDFSNDLPASQYLGRNGEEELLCIRVYGFHERNLREKP